jgi:hypothetical protein
MTPDIVADAQFHPKGVEELLHYGQRVLRPVNCRQLSAMQNQVRGTQFSTPDHVCDDQDESMSA